MCANSDFAVGSKDIDRFEELLVDILDEDLNGLVQYFLVLRRYGPSV